MRHAAILAALALAGAACTSSVTPGVEAQAQADCALQGGLHHFEVLSPLHVGGSQGYTAMCRNGARVERMFFARDKGQS